MHTMGAAQATTNNKADDAYRLGMIIIVLIGMMKQPSWRTILFSLLLPLMIIVFPGHPAVEPP